MTPEEFLALKKSVEKAQRQADQEAGAADQLLKRLKKEFGVENEKEAQEKLEEMQTDLIRLEKKFAKAEEEFLQEFVKDDNGQD